MKVVLLAGGKGTRISEYSEFIPKPLIEIGGMPVLWHIMKEYSHFGFNDFIICAGYKQEKIKQWFSDYYINASDITFDLSKPGMVEIHRQYSEPWKVTVVNTGENTMTGGRIRRIKDYIDGDTFMMTYGDGVCDVNISKLLEFHKAHGKIATLTTVKYSQDKGVIEVDENTNSVRSFREKNRARDCLINAGYMVFNRKIFDYLASDDTVLEGEAMETLTQEKQLMSYLHEGFWQCMDTIIQKRQLEDLWANGKAPWKKWV